MLPVPYHVLAEKAPNKLVMFRHRVCHINGHLFRLVPKAECSGWIESEEIKKRHAQNRACSLFIHH